ncbi:probable carboxypeptidase X1 [Pocillopora verrucosa]|uniref:probable carboxypeptidase X1 n=1 Tax=Pocillopora verrucosa TaxID=203993 RepID=UPI003342C3E2
MDFLLKGNTLILIIFTMALLLTPWTDAQRCPNEEELGVKVPSSKRIPDKYMTSSSHQSNGHQAFRGRIGLESKGSWADGWCASQSDSDPYIQIFFEHLTYFTIIESEGVVIDGEKIFVKAFEVSNSNDSKDWTFYSEGGIRKQFSANDDVKAKNTTLKDTWAHYIRIYPKSRTGKWMCMRIALYGCPSDGPRKFLDSDLISNGALAKKPLKETLFLVIPIVLFGCVIIAGLLCFCCRHRPKRARRIREKKEKKEKEAQPQTEAKLGIDNGVIYEQPPPYEFQTVSLDFNNDMEDGGIPNDNLAQLEKPVFTDDNKFFSFERNAIDYS